MRARTIAALVLLGALAITGPILASTLVGPTRSTDANCSSCHGSLYYLRVEITDLSTPASMDIDGTDQATLTVKVSADGKNSRYYFSMTARIVAENSLIQVSSQQTDSGRVPAGTSEPYTWTKTYTFTLTGKVAGTESLRAEAVMDPSHESPAVKETSTDTVEVRSVNRAPSLTLGGVSPVTGDTETAFAYGVRYSDPDGDAPSFVRVVIDGTDTRELTLTDGNGDSYVTGETFSLTGVTLGEGDHDHHFITSDGEFSARFPAGVNNGPDVVKANAAPVLSDPSLEPASGVPGVNFTFSVTYTDAEGTPPSGGVELLIDGDPHDMELDMNASTGLRDGSYLNGERFVRVLSLGEGIHDHSFRATDGKKEAFLGPFDGPAVSSVPVLSVSMAKPAAGRYLVGTILEFSCSALTNVEDAIVEYRWTSNVSGDLSVLSGFSMVLPAGHHMVTVYARIASHDLSASSTVSVEITEDAPPLPPFRVLGSDPAGDVVLNETEWALFSVGIEILSGPGPSLIWELDGEEAGIGPELNLTTDHARAGVYSLVLKIIHEGKEHSRISWNVTVLDVPAPIIVTDDGWSIDKRFSIGDRITISLPLDDPLGRSLSVAWLIDGIPFEGGTDLLLVAGERPFADPGVHEVRAIARNPDGSVHTMEFSFRVTGIPDTGDPPVMTEKDDGTRIETPGIAILVAGSAALLGGMVYLVAISLPARKASDEVYE